MIEKIKATFAEWIKAAGIRAVKTVAESAASTIGTSIALGDVNWITVASTAVLSGILSLITSIAGIPEVDGATGKKWILAAGVRALKTVAQTAVARIGTAAMMGDVDWIAVGSSAALAGVLSLLLSLAGLPEAKKTINY